MRKYIVLLIISISAISIQAQSLKKAYKALEKSDFAKAKEILNKLTATDKENPAANFGLAMILADDKSPYFNIIEAWGYTTTVQKNKGKLTQEEMEIVSEYFLNTEVRRTSRPVKKKMEIALGAVEARLIKYIREENNIEACYEVLEKYPDYKHYDNVIHIRNQFEYRKYEKMNTFEGYEEFIQKFPDAAQVPKAERHRNKMAFEKLKAQNTAEGYNGYIKQYPNSRYVQQAIKLRNAVAFQNARKLHTLGAYDNFIAEYPDALEIPEAKVFQRELMYEKAKRIKSLEAYNDFIRNYPDGGYYMDVFDLKASDLGKKTIEELSINSPGLLWVKSFDNNQYIEEAQAILSTKDGGYVAAGVTRENDSSYADAWIVKLDNSGKMIWNKTIGQALEDKVLNVMETSEGKVIVLGYTQVSTDSGAPDMGWMFMLDADGSRIWNKNLGELTISASAITSDNKVLIASYLNDTIPDNYYMQIYNSEGTMIGERDFVKYGHFNSIDITDQENVLLSGTKWFTFTDPKYYIKWEDTLKVNTDILKAHTNGKVAVFVSEDSLNRFITSYSIEGKVKWQRGIPISDSVDAINEVFITDDNNTVLLGQNSQYSYIKKFDPTGAPGAEKQFPLGYWFKKMIRGRNGEIIYLIDGQDYVIMAFSSPSL